MEWQPIETVPRDGTQFLVPSQWSGLHIDVAVYDETSPNGYFWWSVKLELPINEPKYWMPIPPEPE